MQEWLTPDPSALGLLCRFTSPVIRTMPRALNVRVPIETEREDYTYGKI